MCVCMCACVCVCVRQKSSVSCWATRAVARVRYCILHFVLCCTTLYSAAWVFFCALASKCTETWHGACCICKFHNPNPNRIQRGKGRTTDCLHKTTVGAPAHHTHTHTHTGWFLRATRRTGRQGVVGWGPPGCARMGRIPPSQSSLHFTTD